MIVAGINLTIAIGLIAAKPGRARHYNVKALDLGQPDHRLDGFDLTEERTHILEGVVPPMREQAGHRRRDAPVGLVLESAPAFDVGANPIDDRGRVVSGPDKVERPET